VERSPGSAAEHFREALEDVPRNTDANYGLGYALLKLGKNREAVTYLCRARSGDLSTQREVSGLLAEHDLTCD
jgi:hypothetical protein